jgi:hypothetical protein
MATYYIDFTNGSDSNNGTSPSTPWKYAPGMTPDVSGNAAITPSASDVIKLKRGEVWRLTSRWVASFLWGDDVMLSSYYNSDGSDDTEQAKPVVDLRHFFITGDWALHSGTVWKTTSIPNNGVNFITERVFFDDIGQGKAASAGAVNAANPWFYDTSNGDLYVYSTSGTLTPSETQGEVSCTYYGDVNEYGSYALFLNTCSPLTVENIRFNGGALASIALSNNNASNILTDVIVQNSECKLFARSGVDILSGSSSSGPVSDISISGNFIDKVWQTEEVDSTNQLGNGISISDGAQKVVVDNNDVRGICHTALLVQAVNGYQVNDRIVFKRNRCETNNTYGRGLATTGTSGNTKRVKFYRNTFTNFITRNQIQGLDITVCGNLFDTTRSEVVAGTGQMISVAASSATQVENVIIAHNTLKNSSGVPIRIDGSIASYPITSLEIKNNVVLQESGYETTVVDYNLNGQTEGTIEVHNNIFYCDGTTAQIDWDDAGVVDWDAAQTAESQLVGNISQDPKLGSNSKPVGDSPCYHAGEYVNSKMRDFNGRPYCIPPTIGAYDSTSGFPAQARTART